MHILLPSISLFVLLYHILAPFYDSRKKRAWIITALASGISTLAALPFLHALLTTRGDILAINTHRTLILNKLFQAYLISDLLTGSVHYPSYISLSTGWFHHIFYTLLVQLSIQRTYTPIFACALIMELPTFILALGSLHPTRMRNDILFAATFLTTRIVGHAAFILFFLLERSPGRRAVGGSLVPAICFALPFPMHVIWFVGCVKGFKKRASTRVRTKEREKISHVPSQKTITLSFPHPLPSKISKLLPNHMRPFSSPSPSSPTHPHRAKHLLHNLRQNLEAKTRASRERVYEYVGLGRGPIPTPTNLLTPDIDRKRIGNEEPMYVVVY